MMCLAFVNHVGWSDLSIGQGHGHGQGHELCKMSNLGAIGWQLNSQEIESLNKASQAIEPYPHWHQHNWGDNRNPGLV